MGGCENSLNHKGYSPCPFCIFAGAYGCRTMFGRNYCTRAFAWFTFTVSLSGDWRLGVPLFFVLMSAVRARESRLPESTTGNRSFGHYKTAPCCLTCCLCCLSRVWGMRLNCTLGCSAAGSFVLASSFQAPCALPFCHRCSCLVVRHHGMWLADDQNNSGDGDVDAWTCVLKIGAFSGVTLPSCVCPAWLNT